MDYLISGGLGFIGTNLAIHLSSTSLSFKLLDKLTGCNICNSLVSQPHCKTFVHLAAFTNVRESIKDPKFAIESNIRGLTNCLDFSRESEANFLFTSSMGADLALSPYTASKLAGEAICSAYRESYGMSVTVLKLSNVYGPYSAHKTSVVSQFIKSCISKQDITIYGNGLQTRDFIHVDDVCNVILSTPQAKVVRVASGSETSILELAEIIRSLSSELIDFTPEIKWKAFVKGEITKIDPSTDIKTTVLLREGLKSTFKWFQDHYAQAQRLERAGS